MLSKSALSLTSFVFALSLLSGNAGASHSWGNYHWERSANPLPLDLGDNMNSTWDPHLVTASSDWSKSSVLDTAIVAGGTDPKRCRPTSGRVEVCNWRYGNNGWLGLAQIWISGDHITQGVAKNNDYYFDVQPYDSVAWRNFVTCQEIGHTFGLDHQDGNFDNPNLGSCMDYTSDPGSNQHPNAHDYDQLEAIYAHLDGVQNDGGGQTCNPRSPKCNARSGGPPAFDDLDLDGPGQWGRLIGASASGRTSTYELDFGNGNRIITHVIWAVDSD